jgi:hypothetical protein
MIAKKLSSLWLFVALTSCAAVDFNQARPGQFSGSVFVMWVGEGDGSGDGNFLFVPDPRDRLTFRRADPKESRYIAKIAQSTRLARGS